MIKKKIHLFNTHYIEGTERKGNKLEDKQKQDHVLGNMRQSSTQQRREIPQILEEDRNIRL